MRLFGADPMLAQAIEELRSAETERDLARQRAASAEALAGAHLRTIERLEAQLEASEAARNEAVQSRMRSLDIVNEKLLSVRSEQSPPSHEQLKNLTELTKKPTPHSHLRNLDRNMITSAITEAKQKLIEKVQ